MADGGPRGAAGCPAGLRHQPLPLRTADDRRPTVRAHESRPGGVARSGDRRAEVGLQPSDLEARRHHDAPGRRAGHRVLVRRREGAAVRRHDRPPARLDRRRQRRGRPRLRRGRRGRPGARSRPGRVHRSPHHPRRASDRGRQQCHRGLQDLRLLGEERRAAGTRPGLRRPHRRVQVALQHHPAGRRGRGRDLGERILAHRRQRERMDGDERRPRTGLRLPADEHAFERLLRRRPARRQPVRREPGLRRRGHRRAHLALPDRPPRHLGLRHRLAAEPDRHRRRRQADQGRGSGFQDRLHLRLRPRDRQAGVADRGATGERQVDGGWREAVRDPAGPDQAARVRAPGRQ